MNSTHSQPPAAGEESIRSTATKAYAEIYGGLGNGLPMFIRGYCAAHEAGPHAGLMAALEETADQLEDLIEATEGLAGLDQFQKDALANSRVVLRVVARAELAKGVLS